MQYWDPLLEGNPNRARSPGRGEAVGRRARGSSSTHESFLNCCLLLEGDFSRLHFVPSLFHRS